ncbi:MAG TPA: response regulator transcription factor [Polyangiaceae bacterium]
MTETILVVEDDPSILRGLEMNLQLEGYAVISGRDGKEGLALLEQQRPDLIVLDIMLPKCDGFSVIRSARQSHADTPIIVLSARGEEADKLLGLSLGADDYVTKPFSLPELLARIRTVLRRQRRSMPATGLLRFGAVEVDTGARRLLVDGRPVETTSREFDLLSFFLAHDDVAVSRVQILRAVWGADQAITERTVDNFVARLRTKIERNPAEPNHLLTVRGVGYRFSSKPAG